MTDLELQKNFSLVAQVRRSRYQPGNVDIIDIWF